MKKTLKYLPFIIFGLMIIGEFYANPPAFAEKIGVLLAVHGGNDESLDQYWFDGGIQQFAYRPDHIVHKYILWNKGQWPIVLDEEQAKKFVIKGNLMWERMGGIDPQQSITDKQLDDLGAELNAISCAGKTFVVDWVAWITGDRLDHLPYPRFLYHPPDYIQPSATLPEHLISNLTYCGEQQTDNVVLQFSNGSSPFSTGATLSGASSGATGVITHITVDSGSWATGDATGTIALSDLTFITGTCARKGTACTQGSNCGLLDFCMGDYFSDGELITDDGSPGGSAIAVGTTHWPDCDPERYNVDGPIERFIDEGVDKIVVVDLTVGGVRFFKTYDTIQMLKRAMADNGVDIPLFWVNDPGNLMERSYPVDPIGFNGLFWTTDLKEPNIDPSVDLTENPNPVSEDMDLAQLHVEGIESSRNPSVSWADTAVLLLNHAHRDYGQNYDPKIDDTLILNKHIKSLLISRHPDMNPENIIGAYMGIKEYGSAEGGPQGELERTRRMRGENLGQAWLYEGAGDIVIDFQQGTSSFTPGATVFGKTSWATATIEKVTLLDGDWLAGNAIGTLTLSGTGIGRFFKDEIIVDDGSPPGSATTRSKTKWANRLPDPPWGYKYWDALETLKNRRVQHIIICFPQIIIDSFYNVEIPNQIAKEIGYKTWLKWGTWDFELYPTAGHPFFDYWGIWVDTECFDGGGPLHECCFEMGGCPDGRPYPPPRQTSGPRGDFDPSLAYDVSAFGHLGYDPDLGPPDPDMPVQNQYGGTWAMWKIPGRDPRVGKILAKHVQKEVCPTLINLIDFKALPDNGKIILTWKTSSEVDNAGFYLYRAESKDGKYIKINNTLIQAKGTVTQGASYEFVDMDVKIRKIYYYILEDIDLSGKGTFHGPVDASPGLLLRK